ncbi:hypothetical protein FZC79_19785 [Rossellomorea vietnamensis]|uniref:Uncharacterized protein n=1 Tax=Rossellomorea vietnamensis TaxID=218284 RepID=A0A5D4K707_9BACI|nr:hypothetical protein FZC79_19785 [Rossellomorea vietnamensis]
MVSLIVSLLFPLIYRNKEKKDKGFIFAYYGLSYRRKMIRTVWNIPLIIILLIGISVWGKLNFYQTFLISVFFFVTLIVQFLYNYYKWKKHEKQVR